MSDNIENLVLEHLKRFQSSNERIERELREIKSRLAGLEAGQASVIQHIGHLSASIATQQVALDGMNQRIDRIEHRLEIA